MVPKPNVIGHVMASPIRDAFAASRRLKQVEDPQRSADSAEALPAAPAFSRADRHCTDTGRVERTGLRK